MKYNYNAPWHPLKSVCLGDTYSDSFYRDIRDNQVRDMLQLIANETKEDFKYIESIFKSLNIDVVRPYLDDQATIMDYVDSNNRLTFDQTGTYALIPKPPMQPRDSQLIIGDVFWSTNNDINLSPFLKVKFK